MAIPSDPKKAELWKKRQSDSHKGQHPIGEWKKGHKTWNKGIPMSEETKKKLSLAKQGKTGHKHTEETKLKLSMKLKGRVFTDEWKKKISLSRSDKSSWNKGKHLSEAAKEKIRQSRKNKYSGENHPWYGKHHSLATKLKISEAHKGIKPTEEVRKRMSMAHKGKRVGNKHPMYGKPAANRGVLHTEETRAKLREARKYRKIPFHDTKPERMMQIALTLNGIKFETHKPIVGQPDIFIEPNICIFVDGDYWHANPKKYKVDDYIIRGKKASDIWAKDMMVNHKLQQMGLFVLRFWESEILNETQGCAEKIMKMLQIYHKKVVA